MVSQYRRILSLCLCLSVCLSHMCLQHSRAYSGITRTGCKVQIDVMLLSRIIKVFGFEFSLSYSLSLFHLPILSFGSPSFSVPQVLFVGTNTFLDEHYAGYSPSDVIICCLRQDPVERLCHPTHTFVKIPTSRLGKVVVVTVVRTKRPSHRQAFTLVCRKRNRDNTFRNDILKQDIKGSLGRYFSQSYTKWLV